MSGPAPLAWNAAAARFSKARSDTGIELVRAWADALPRGARVLDVGCGPGKPITELLAAKGCRVHGLDAAPAMTAAASTN